LTRYRERVVRSFPPSGGVEPVEPGIPDDRVPVMADDRAPGRPYAPRVKLRRHENGAIATDPGQLDRNHAHLLGSITPTGRQRPDRTGRDAETRQDQSVDALVAKIELDAKASDERLVGIPRRFRDPDLIGPAPTKDLAGFNGTIRRATAQHDDRARMLE